MASSHLLEVSEREFHTILAALRVYQNEQCDEEIHDIATNGGEVQALDEEEIDDLCERINT